ncbi:MAG: Lrp/AsnC family transcriptional regulator [Candidatus Woesearchaeota archaeon]|jgi:DNA-binding Lrp family transcriptional regulator
MIKFDFKDRKIIYQLSLNARQSYSEIAKKVGLSPQSVDYKISRLEKLGVITGYYTCIDISKIGYSIFKIYIKLQNLDAEKEKEMIHNLQKNPHITWVASCDGMWDLYLVIWSKNIFEFDEIFNEINNQYSYYFSKKSIIATTKVLQFMRKYLAPDKKSIDYSKIEWAGEVSQVNLDHTDFQILLHLSQEARISDSELGQRLNISRKVVDYRIKKMESQKVIYGYKPFLNGNLLNFETYKFFLTLQSFTPEKEQRLIAFLNAHSAVIEVNYTLGNWELELDIESPNIDANHELIRELRNQFNDVIRDCDIMHISKSYRYDYLPKGLAEIKKSS